MVATQSKTKAKDAVKFGRIVFFPCGDQVRQATFKPTNIYLH